MEYRFRPSGVCSTEMIFNIENDKVKDLKVIGGCNGNLKGISALVEGQDINDMKNKLKGIKCNNKNTSCPDQLAKAIEEYNREWKYHSFILTYY